MACWSRYPGIIAFIGRGAMENIANSDAPYHNAEHTMMVTLVGQEILRVKHIREGGVTPRDQARGRVCEHERRRAKAICVWKEGVRPLIGLGLVGRMSKLDEICTLGSCRPVWLAQACVA